MARKIYYLGAKPVFRLCYLFKHDGCPGLNTYMHQQHCECACHFIRKGKKK